MPTTTPIDSPAKAFVFVEDGQCGIQTRVFMSRPGAEKALIAAGLEYQTAGKPIYTQSDLETHLRRMQAAELRGESYVIECADLGVLWINAVDIEA